MRTEELERGAGHFENVLNVIKLQEKIHKRMKKFATL